MSRHLHFPGHRNDSGNETFSDVLSRRAFLKGALGAAAAALLPGRPFAEERTRIGFSAIAASSEDSVRVPPGYEAKVLFRWGDPVGAVAGSPQFRMDASNSAAEQALQAGMHHDGMHFFPLPEPGRGLLAINHEYLDMRLLFPDGQSAWSAEKVLKAQNAVGVSIIEIRLAGNDWAVVRPSRYARRITARTHCRVSGPAAGHPLMRTAADPGGRSVLGTLSNCGRGWTPWGTYLTCEENFNLEFANRGAIPPEQRRYGIFPNGAGWRWEEYDERFDAARHPNEVNRFGWVVEIDPYDPASVPVKRTALGRIKHETAACAMAADGRVAFYTGDDDELEYIYKFVTARPFDANSPGNNRDLLDEGTLYVARFNDDGSGDWLPLTGPQAAIHTRQAADQAGATKMDRPEWIAPHASRGEVYVSLTASYRRGAAGRAAADAANPRAPNPFGHILRWRERGGDAAAERFQWDVYALAGPGGAGNTRGDAFSNPDGLWVDAGGTLWVQTDMSPSALGSGPFAALGNNQMLAVDASGEFRRFLTGPPGCEVTGFHTTADGRTGFVNIQHPGETRGDPRAHSSWPDHEPNGRPRSATVVIRRKDGGIIGS